MNPETWEPPLVLALDVGTSSCRASLYDARGQHVRGAAAQIGYVPTVTSDGGAEVEAEALVARVAEAIDQLATRAGSGFDAVTAVGTSTFWHSLLGVDAAGQPVTPVYLWMDGRSRQAAVSLRRELDERAFHARTGCMLHASYWPAKLRWLRESQPGSWHAVHRWISFGEYLALRLFGRALVGVSMASGTGLFDQHTGSWVPPMLNILDLEPEMLSPIGTSKDLLVGLQPEFAARWPALQEIPWLPAVGDGACSNVGAGCTTRAQLALMIGTSGAMRALWRADDVTIPWGAWCYHADEHRFVMGGALNDGGSLFAWLRQTLQLPPLEAAEQAIAALEPTAHGLTIFPAWAGERSPGWADDARGAIVGLRLHTTPVEILRAALEAIALRFATLDAIISQAVPEAEAIIATGGALLRSPAWLQIMADALGRPVLASTELEASSRGAALLALEAVGNLDGGIETFPPIIDRVYEPVAAHTARYREAAQRQERLYQTVLELSPLEEPALALAASSLTLPTSQAPVT